MTMRGSPCSMMQATEFVVPRSIPMTLPIHSSWALQPGE
jgi:hypothetical protein